MGSIGSLFSSPEVAEQALTADALAVGPLESDGTRKAAAVQCDPFVHDGTMTFDRLVVQAVAARSKEWFGKEYGPASIAGVYRRVDLPEGHLVRPTRIVFEAKRCWCEMEDLAVDSFTPPTEPPPPPPVPPSAEPLPPPSAESPPAVVEASAPATYPTAPASPEGDVGESLAKLRGRVLQAVKDGDDDKALLLSKIISTLLKLDEKKA